MSTQGGTNLADDIHKVTYLIERCLVHYMNQMQVIETLYRQEKIEPIFTKIVWQLLEVQNQEFFKEYYLRLTLNEQIKKFNDLLEKQVALMNQLNNRNEVAVSNGSRIPPMHHPVSTMLQSQNDFNNCGLYIHSGMQHALDDPVAKLLAQNPNDGMNGLPVNNEFGYLGDVMEPLAIDYPYGLSFGNMDTTLRSTIDYPSGSSLNNLDSNSNPTTDNDSISSFGQMDLNTYKLDNSDDISPLLSPYPDNLLDSSNGTIVDNQGKIHVFGENTKLPNISRNMDF